MRALLLAAGFGTRLKPLTDVVPKPLLPVNDTPLILYNLALLKHHGVREVVINLHHLGNQIRRFLGAGRGLGLKIRYSHEPAILGTGGGIAKAARFFDDAILVVNSDVICDLPIRKMLAAHRSGRVLATLALRSHRDAKRLGILTFTGTRLVTLLGHPKGRHGRRRAHFTGIHVLDKKSLAHLSPRARSCIVQNHYIPGLNAGLAIAAFPADGFWSDCGTPQALAKTDASLRSGRVRLHYAKELQKLRRAMARRTHALLQKIYSADAACVLQQGMRD